jgi:hypothetical protein
MRIQNFSNPNVTFNDFPTGVPQASPQSADAATSLNATALTVANWRAEVSFPTIIGVYSNGAWFLDWNGNQQWDGCGVEACFGFEIVGDVPVVGDWTGTGQAKVGVYRNGALEWKRSVRWLCGGYLCRVWDSWGCAGGGRLVADLLDSCVLLWIWRPHETK